MTEQIRQNHINNRLAEAALSLEETGEMLEDGVEGKANILRSINPWEFLAVVRTKADNKDTRGFQAYLEALRNQGLDIGKGDAEYGFKMPLPQEGDSWRKLIIFRRYKK